jgi:hypothetical protein
MSNRVIPDEAIEAAAEGMHGLTGIGPWVRLDERSRERRILEARAALESAVQHLCSGRHWIVAPEDDSGW